jgi:hypothetical protein
MIDQFNRINQAIGANRMRVVDVYITYIQFEILNWGMFCVWSAGDLMECRNGGYSHTPNARWLHGISLGKKRDDAGVLS